MLNLKVSIKKKNNKVNYNLSYEINSWFGKFGGEV